MSSPTASRRRRRRYSSWPPAASRRRARSSRPCCRPRGDGAAAARRPSTQRLTAARRARRRPESRRCHCPAPRCALRNGCVELNRGLPRMALIAPYDPNRFTSAIPHYINGRPAYAQRLIAKLARETRLDAQFARARPRLRARLADAAAVALLRHDDRHRRRSGDDRRGGDRRRNSPGCRSNGASAPRSISPTIWRRSISSPSPAPSTGWIARRRCSGSMS